MAQWNQTEKILQTKIVYYGPALSGKTTNLQQIHRFTDPKGENHLISLNTTSDRTLFFDLLPLDLGKISGYTVKVQLYTVPGQVRYDATRRIVLSGADSVVFVADSQPGKGAENRAAWENLKANLKANGLDPAAVPIVVQYNKQDLPSRLARKEIEASLRSSQEGISSSAIRGVGVMETFRLAVLMMLRRLSALSGRRRVEDLTELEDQASRALDRCLLAYRASGVQEQALLAAPASSPTTIHFTEDAAGEDLLARSLRANLGVAEQFAEMRELKVRLQHRIGELESLQTLTRELSERRETDSILGDLIDAALSVPGATGAALLAGESEGSALRTILLRGLPRDPMAASGTVAGPISELLLRGEPALIDDFPGTGVFAVPSASGAPRSAMAVPLLSARSPARLLLVYGDAPFTADDLRFLSLLGAHAAVCIENVAMTERLTRYSEHLEQEVRARTIDLERANDELRELDKMKDRFLSSVSHEMKTPLTGIISGAELLAALIPEDDDRREFVSIIAAEGQHLASLVDQMLKVQILGRHGPPGTVGPVDPAELISNTVRGASAAAASRGVEIKTDLAARAPHIVGDPDGLALALSEVLDNAIKFSAPGGKIHVGAREELLRKAVTEVPEAALDEREPPAVHELDVERFVVISVRDEGPGIPQAEHTRIFEKFEQLGNILTSKPHGLGLGLPIAREIARRHGGDLRVQSDVGAGSVFQLYLPASPLGAGELMDVAVEVAT